MLPGWGLCQAMGQTDSGAREVRDLANEEVRSQTTELVSWGGGKQRKVSGQVTDLDKNRKKGCGLVVFAHLAGTVVDEARVWVRRRRGGDATGEEEAGRACPLWQVGPAGESAVTSDDCGAGLEAWALSQGASVRTDAVVLQKQAAPFPCQAMWPAFNKP